MRRVMTEASSVSGCTLSEALARWRPLMESERSVDPYLIWSDLTCYRQFRGPDRSQPRGLSFLVELPGPYKREDFEDILSQAGVSVPSVYEESLDDAKTATFVTVHLTLGPDDEVPIEGIIDLIQTQRIARLQLGFPVSMPLDDRCKRPTCDTAPPITFPKDIDATVTCAVLDDGCAFAHEQFRVAADTPATRVVALWDQTPMTCGSIKKRGDAWHRVDSMGYGLEIINSALNAHIQANRFGTDIEEDRCYRQAFGDKLHGLDGCNTHGTRVMDLMTGRIDPRSPSNADVDRPCAVRVANGPDASAAAPIVFVQFPYAVNTISNARWLAIHALDGLHYVLDVVRRYNLAVPSRERKIVVNLSYGGLAGPHDGTGMLMRAIDEVCQVRGNVAIVLAAGNSRSARSHVKRTITNEAACFRFVIPPDKQFETYLELWFPDDEAASAVEISISPPRNPGKPVERGGITTWRQDEVCSGGRGRQVVAAAIFAPRVVQGVNGTMMLLAVAGAQLTGRFPWSPPGEWCVHVRTKDGSEKRFDAHAWLERDDLRSAHRSQFAYFESDTDEPNVPNYVTPFKTVTNIVGGKFPIPVGGYVDVVSIRMAPGSRTGEASEQGQLGTMAAYSGLGDDHKDAPPTIYAKTDCGFALMAIRAAGNRSGGTARISGTSAAAPQLARAFVNAMAAHKGSMSAGEISKLPGAIVLSDPSFLRPARLASPDPMRLEQVVPML